MFFEIKFSFFFSFNVRNGDTSERHQSLGDQDQDHTSRPVVLQHAIEPGAMIREPVVTSAPVRPVLSRFACYFQTQSATRNGHQPETDNTQIAETHLAKANDRESLWILLRSTSPAPSTGTVGELSDSSLVNHNPVASTTMLPQGPFVVRQSPLLEDDSGSDLVSSLQRIRIGGLASYFEQLKRHAHAQTLASTAARISGGDDQRLIDDLEADQSPRTYHVVDGEWSEMTLRVASDEE